VWGVEGFLPHNNFVQKSKAGRGGTGTHHCAESGHGGEIVVMLLFTGNSLLQNEHFSTHDGMRFTREYLSYSSSPNHLLPLIVVSLGAPLPWP